jgi:hypothetical protein
MTTYTNPKTETELNGSPVSKKIQLSANRIFRIDQRLGDMEIQALNGTLWVTLPNDPNDYVLKDGDRLSVRSKGTVLLEALSEASFTIN